MSAWIGFAACDIARVPILLYGDSSFLPDDHSPRGQARAAILRSLFRMTTAFMISGVRNADYYLHYGADPGDFFPMPWAIDNDRFFEQSRVSPEERKNLRRRLGIDDRELAVIYSGKLIPRKDPLTLLRAIEAMEYPAVAVFVGDGEMLGILQDYARDHNIHAVFPGFVNQTQLPQYYAMSDVFVLPSRFDPRATVVNEAMACGLPIVITDRCGPSADIVRHDDNGFVFAAGDHHDLARHLCRIASDPELRERMSLRSRAIISRWSYEQDVEGLLTALAAIAGRGQR
jgi:glycosyltransferase involved in cell wall biosynthesis